MSSTVNSRDQATATARPLSEVERDIAAAIEELSALKAKREELSENVAAATEALDAARLDELERRGRELEAQTGEAKCRLWRVQAERARLLLPAAEEEAEAARAEYQRAYAAYLEAHARVNRLGVEADNADMRAAGLRHEAEEHERRVREHVFRPAARQS